MGVITFAITILIYAMSMIGVVYLVVFVSGDAVGLADARRKP